MSQKAELKGETRDFVPKFVAATLIATNPQKYGFDLIDYDSPLDYKEVEVGGHRQLASLAEIAGVEAQTIKELNPELVQSTTPPGENHFRLKLPIGYSAIAALLRPEEKQPDDRCRERQSSFTRFDEANSSLDRAPLRTRG